MPSSSDDHHADGYVVLAPDKFRGSLTAAEVAHHLQVGLRHAVPHLGLRVVPVADGGEGTVEAAVAQGFAAIRTRVRGPLGTPVEATIAVRDGTAVVELAQASGLQQVTPDAEASLVANTYGTGELIVSALDAGCSTVVLGLGGSASTDGGAGMLQALGVRLTNALGEETPLGRGHAFTAQGADFSGMDPRIARTKFVVASDVDHALFGPTGAAHVFAPQKGATPTEVALLDEGLRRWSDIVDRDSGTKAEQGTRPGAGAAGGVGFAALAVLKGETRPGIDVILELAGFRELLEGARLVITGEGSLDEQTLGGKAPVGVARLAGAAGVKTLAIAGRTTLSPDALRAAGFAATYTLQQRAPDLSVCMREAPRLLSETGLVIARDWLVGTPMTTSVRSGQHERQDREGGDNG